MTKKESDHPTLLLYGRGEQNVCHINSDSEIKDDYTIRTHTEGPTANLFYIIKPTFLS